MGLLRRIFGAEVVPLRPANAVGAVDVVGTDDIIEAGDGATYIVRHAVHLPDGATVCLLDDGTSANNTVAVFADGRLRRYIPGARVVGSVIASGVDDRGTAIDVVAGSGDYAVVVGDTTWVASPHNTSAFAIPALVTSADEPVAISGCRDLPEPGPDEEI